MKLEIFNYILQKKVKIFQKLENFNYILQKKCSMNCCQFWICVFWLVVFGGAGAGDRKHIPGYFSIYKMYRILNIVISVGDWITIGYIPIDRLRVIQ